MVSPITSPPAFPTARIPEDSEYAFFGGTKRPLQVNFCKNPRCANYGVPPSIAVKYARRAKAGAAPGVDYRLSAHGAGLPNLHCLLCKESIPVKSNLGVAEELVRLSAPFAERAPICCPRPGCSNGAVPAPDPKAYYRFGKTEGGSARYQCRACKKTFSEAVRATLRQREPRKNVPVLTSLMNKMPLTRITEAHGISPQTVYDKLDFFAKQAEAFAAKHERRLPEVVRGTKRYLAIDRQEYAVNWTHRKDRRNVVIRALGSLHAIDRFFMSIRRRLNMLERPVATSSKAGRTWYGYSAYQPENIGKLLTVFRAYYNYCLAGRDGKTPAMRLGLTSAPVSPSDLLGQ